ncbi:AAA family ATPase [Thiomicrorhabdus sp.]|uniref:AAA family ATPase n=1 Tax=Thiomicrorhabdus sp. TaxID=2039724 RepID=UPI002AA7F900|nr:AAA family ATPase [Thiomicrorhabdus sp.]
MDISLAIPDADMFDRIGLTESPFPVTPDASHYFCSQRLESHVLELMHCIHMRKGFLLFTADVGLGKSTLSRYLINNLDELDTDISLVLNTFLQGVELLKAINDDFGMKVEGGIKEQLDALNSFLLRQYANQRNCLIIIDDAQNLSTESLEMIRLISNFEVSTHKLVQILLIAQPEIMLTLNLPQIRQLKSRIALHIELAPFTEQEVLDYVYFRLDGAGNQHNICLTKKAGKQLHKLSKGYPRRINLIMDRVLYALLVDANTLVSDKLIILANNDIEQVRYDGDVSKKANAYRTKAYMTGFAAVLILGLVFWQFEPKAWMSRLSEQKIVTDSYASLPLSEEAVDKKEVLKNTLINAPFEQVKVNVTKDLPGLVNQAVATELVKKNVNTEFNYFLRDYGIKDPKGELASALTQENWDLLKKQILQQGWELLLNKKPFIGPARAVLKLESSNQKKYWLMLWKPKLTFSKYYFGMKSSNVERLQKLLKQEGFFKFSEDAVLGSKTMYAVANFQRSVGIEPTGKADSLTLYFLTRDNSALVM